jgi:hypothetical protein
MAACAVDVERSARPRAQAVLTVDSRTAARCGVSFHGLACVHINGESAVAQLRVVCDDRQSALLVEPRGAHAPESAAAATVEPLRRADVQRCVPVGRSAL